MKLKNLTKPLLFACLSIAFTSAESYGAPVAASTVPPLVERLAETAIGVAKGERLFVVDSQFRRLFRPEKDQPKDRRPALFTPLSVSLPDLQAGELRLPPGFQYPNGVARASDGTLYVGSVTSGRILRRQPSGVWETAFPETAKVYAATSLRLDEDRALLWGASPDFLPGDRARPHRIFAFDLVSGVVVNALELPDGGFGNDLALAPNGDVLVTDSRNGRVLRLASGSDRFEILVEDARLAPIGGVGVGGIARAPDGTLVLGNYGSGRLYVLDPVGVGPERLREIALPRLIENPDGLAFAPDGALILLEGAVRSGDGKVLHVPNPLGMGMRRLQPLLSGLESPVNLTLASDGRAWVTEARIRHRLLPGRERDVPASFRVVTLNLPNSRPTSASVLLDAVAASRIVVVSDGDFLGSTYADGRLAPAGSGADVLTLLSRRDGRFSSESVAVSNSVTGPPEVMALSPDGRRAYVVERLAQRSTGALRVPDLEPGRRLSIVSLDGSPRVLGAVEIGANPESVRVSPDGRRLAITSSDTAGSYVHLVPIGVDGQMDKVQTIKLADVGVVGDRPGPRQGITATFADWSPDGRRLAVNLNTLNRVAFFDVVAGPNPNLGLRLSGAPIEVGPDPFVGRFSPDGRYYLTSDWGRNLGATSLAGRLPERTSTLTVIRLADAGTKDPVHRVVSEVATDRSAEGLAISRDGRRVATVNMRETAFDPAHPRFTRSASVSLLDLNPVTGGLTKVAGTTFDGVLPEGAAFDADGEHLLVTVFADHGGGPGGLHVFKIINANPPRLNALGRMPLPSGAHHVEIIP